MRAKFLGGSCAALALLAFCLIEPSSVRACSCAEDHQVRLLSPTDRPLPRNVQLRVSIPRDGVMFPGMQPGEKLAQPGEVRISLTDVASGRELPILERRLDGGSRFLLLLSSKLPLPARGTYELHATQGQRRASLGKISVGAAEDRAAPGSGLVKAVFVPPPAEPPHGGSCKTGNATVGVELTPLREEGDKKTPLYLIWIGPGDKPIDFRAPPTYATQLRADHNTLQLGRSHICGHSLEWTPQPNQTELRIGLVAHDEAGNASDPIEQRVALSK